jgi:hypothetical protein
LEGFPIGGAERGDDRIVHRDIRAGGRFRGIEAEQGGFVLGDGEGEGKVLGLEGFTPEEVPPIQLLSQEGVAVPLDVLGQQQVGAFDVDVDLAGTAGPALISAEFRDFGVFLAFEPKLSDRLNSFSHLPFGAHSGIAGGFIVQAAQ